MSTVDDIDSPVDAAGTEATQGEDSAPATQPDAKAAPSLDGAIVQEDRFGVVLYGGVSLAVYITGVCIELLNLVRSTSESRHREAARSIPIYRLAAAIIDDGPRWGTPVGAWHERIAESTAQLEAVQAYLEANKKHLENGEPFEPRDPLCEPRRRFVVDVLSGTSAGGLNAVYLAKALSHDQDISKLRELWVEQGGFSEILNDADAAALHQQTTSGRHDVSERKPARSLLSGDLMYLKLLAALEQMDQEADGDAAPLVDAVDCFLTTTDLRGLAMPVRLGEHDSIVEPRHRSVFHLRHGSREATGLPFDQFQSHRNPSLAFMARATSAHPAAFEPVQLKDVDDKLNDWFRGDFTGFDLAEDGFVSDHISPQLAYEGDWDMFLRSRWFSDGGDMDNKPFSYALQPLPDRRADVPVKRRLLYVEPDPQPVTWRNNDRPTLLETTLDAYKLGRFEAIRDDIETIQDRNEVIERVRWGFRNRIALFLEGIHADAKPAGPPRPTELRTKWWVNRPRHDALLDDGVGADGLAAEQDEALLVGGMVGGVMARAAGLAPDSAQTRFLMRLVERWVYDRHIAPSNLQASTAPSDHEPQPELRHRELLLTCGVSFRLRRLMFTDQVCEQIQRAALYRSGARLLTRWGLAQEIVADDRADVFEAMRRLRSDLNEVYVDLRTIEMLLNRNRLGTALAVRQPAWQAHRTEQRARPGDEALAEALQALSKNQRDLGLAAPFLESWPERMPELHRVLREYAERTSTSDEMSPSVELEYQLHAAELHDLFDELGRALYPWFALTRAKALAIIEHHTKRWPRLATSLEQLFVEYHRFDPTILPAWDAVRGEVAAADVTRVSPLDATSLVAMSTVAGHEVRKLAGNSMANFSGFLVPEWRANDVVWGQLDAAEILLKEVLPPGDDRDLATWLGSEEGASTSGLAAEDREDLISSLVGHADLRDEVRRQLIESAQEAIMRDNWAQVALMPTLAGDDPWTDEPDPHGAREYLQNGFTITEQAGHKLDVSNGDASGRSLVYRLLGVLGEMTVEHGINSARGSKAPGRVAAMFLRALKLGFAIESWRKVQNLMLFVVLLSGVGLFVSGAVVFEWNDWVWLTWAAVGVGVLVTGGLVIGSRAGPMAKVSMLALVGALGVAVLAVALWLTGADRIWAEDAWGVVFVLGSAALQAMVLSAVFRAGSAELSSWSRVLILVAFFGGLALLVVPAFWLPRGIVLALAGLSIVFFALLLGGPSWMLSAAYTSLVRKKPEAPQHHRIVNFGTEDRSRVFDRIANLGDADERGNRPPKVGTSKELLVETPAGERRLVVEYLDVVAGRRVTFSWRLFGQQQPDAPCGTVTFHIQWTENGPVSRVLSRETWSTSAPTDLRAFFSQWLSARSTEEGASVLA